MIRLWVVRHGESSWNAQQRIQGQSGEGLTERGHRQAHAVAGWLAATLGSAPVVTSDLQRARETAHPIAEAMGVEVQVDPALRERAFGRWEGMRAEDLTPEDQALWHRWVTGDRDVIGQEVGGESHADLSQRVLGVVDRLVRKADREASPHMVVVTHGGIVWQALHDVLSLPHPVFAGMDNTSVTVFGFADDAVWLERVNSSAHLAPDEATTFRVRAT